MKQVRELQSQAHNFGKKFKTFLQFEAWIKTKKKAILFHPDYVMMTWETYQSMTKKEKPLVIMDEFKFYDEVANFK